MPLRDIPEPKLTTLDGGKIAPPSESTDIRELRVKEFLQARSLAPKSEKAYRQDLKYFLEWSNISWVELSPRDVAQFKDFLTYKKKWLFRTLRAKFFEKSGLNPCCAYLRATITFINIKFIKFHL